MAVSLLLDFKTAHALHIAARKPVKIGGKTVVLAKAGTVKVRVPFSSKAKKRLAGLRKLTLSVQVVGTDGAGNRTTRTKRLSLR